MSRDEVTLFKSLGLAVEDVAAARTSTGKAARARRRPATVLGGLGEVRATHETDRAVPSLDDIRAARERIAGSALRTPLVRLESSTADFPGEIWLKLENLQPIGSFKLRGAGNAMRARAARGARDGVVTASAGNMAQGVAWNARRLGIPCTVIVPEHAPATKLAAIERLGGKVVKLPFDRWWQTLVEHGHPRTCPASSSTPSAIPP